MITPIRLYLNGAGLFIFIRPEMERGLIAVDEWNSKREAYFLTHLHADHTKGLNSKWHRGPLYCSRLTASLLIIKFPGLEKTLIKPLEVGNPSLISLKSSNLLLEVTPIEAHHCPGAVMYLFRGDFGCELYTGDFRWEVEGLNSVTGKEQLRHALTGAKIGHLHLDNTFCNPRFEFPPRHIAAQKVLDIISLYPEHDIVIGIDALGKEELLVDIARTLKTKIFVRPERLRTMHHLGLRDIFTIDTSVTRVRAVPRYSLTRETLDVLNSMHPTIGILPTGSSLLFQTLSTEGSSNENFHQNNVSGLIKVSFNSSLGGETTKTNMRLIEQHSLASSKNSVNLVSGKMYIVPYSLHCCFSELQSFVELIKPSHITGILASSTCEINPNIYFNHLCEGKQLCLQDEVHHSIHSLSVKRDIYRQVKYHGSESEGFLKFSCKPENNTVKKNVICRRRLRKFLTIYTNKINKCRRKGCGAKLSNWDSDKEDAVEDSFQNGN